MKRLAEVPVSTFFEANNGRAKFIKDYLAAHPGPHPVYSASLTMPFGHVDSYEYDGQYLTWVMNGYGGRVQEVSGKFSANRDRGVFVPRSGIKIPDLTYLRFAMEPALVEAAVGRRVDGHRNEYTKLYPEAATAVSFPVPLDASGAYDYRRMQELGARLRRIEEAKAAVRQALEDVLAARVTIESLILSESASERKPPSAARR